MKRETIVFSGGHPDDLIGSLGLALLLKDRFDLHVVDLTRGEAGWGGHSYEETARVRTAEEEAVCAALGATPHFLGEIDADAYAGRETCARAAELFRALRPRAVIAHWPLDVHADHIMSTAATIKALKLAGLDPEVYFFEETFQSMFFPAIHYVDVSSVFERKVELIRLYACQNGGDGLVRNKTEDAVFRGNQFHVARAEAYAPYRPARAGERCLFLEVPRA